jgi:hypothetical protein
MRIVLAELESVLSTLANDPKHVAAFSVGLKLGMESGALQRDIPSFTQHLSVRAAPEHMQVLRMIDLAGETFRRTIQHILSQLDGEDQRVSDGRVD